ncbi:type II toxin-antitoxin system VapC family toxin [Sorangium sp. So ce315]|uniref:type II toxin-antitoxin system VapC family toxin n=1 Tax=Sorangium sp. So ce315 TaxID=3133299 RepID=UPI003F5DAB5C
MKWLLDTHVVIWFAADPGRLRREVVEAIQDPGAQVLISVASWWELAIKQSIGRLQGSLPPEQLRSWWLGHPTVRELAIEAAHVWTAAAFPLHHRDPFDRMLLAQAQLEDATLVTSDHLVRAYKTPILWACP